MAFKLNSDWLVLRWFGWGIFLCFGSSTFLTVEMQDWNFSEDGEESETSHSNNDMNANNSVWFISDPSYKVEYYIKVPESAVNQSAFWKPGRKMHPTASGPHAHLGRFN